jgi:hypothetical protein
MVAFVINAWVFLFVVGLAGALITTSINYIRNSMRNGWKAGEAIGEANPVSDFEQDRQEAIARAAYQRYVPSFSIVPRPTDPGPDRGRKIRSSPAQKRPSKPFQNPKIANRASGSPGRSSGAYRSNKVEG